ncbi:MAG: hypothetical protein ACOC3X_01740 [Nanoarchaeota archaeon]
MGCSEKDNNCKPLNSMKNNLKEAFLRIKDELNDYRECINQNTNEIQSNYEYMCRMESKIDKLSEKFEELYLIVMEDKNKLKEEKYNIQDLTRKEQEIFMIIYLNNQGCTYYDISKKTGLDENVVICYVTNLIAKGIPLIKKYLSNGIRIFLDDEFKQIQAKNNILKINSSVSKNLY